MGNMISSFFHPEEGYQKAGEQMEKYYRDAQGNLQPYNQNGQNQYSRLNNQAESLNNPAALENEWAQSYQESPYAKQSEAEAKEAGLGAASGMGLMGSSAALSNVQNSSHNIMNQDRQQYMNDLMQKYMQSVGIGQNLYGTGASAAGGMSNNAMSQGKEMGQAAYGEANAPGQMFGNLLGQGVNAGINYATGGVGGASANVGRSVNNGIKGVNFNSPQVY